MDWKSFVSFRHNPNLRSGVSFSPGYHYYIHRDTIPITEIVMSKSKDTKKETKKKPKLSLKEKRQLKKSKHIG
jgi:hypothetical protein